MGKEQFYAIGSKDICSRHLEVWQGDVQGIAYGVSIAIGVYYHSRSLVGMFIIEISHFERHSLILLIHGSTFH